VVLTDTIGAQRREIGPNDSIGTVLAQRVLNDGTVRVVGFSGIGGAVWSIAADNVVTRVAALPNLMLTYAAADISPDGRKIAYIGRTPALGRELLVLDVPSGAVTRVAGSSRSPRWSPDGARVLFTEPEPINGNFDGALVIVNADGTGRRSLGPTLFLPGVAWSPDAAYVVGRDGAGLRIVRVADLVSVALPGGYYQPDWR
jgi:hypothetical protein